MIRNAQEVTRFRRKLVPDQKGPVRGKRSKVTAETHRFCLWVNMSPVYSELCCQPAAVFQLINLLLVSAPGLRGPSRDQAGPGVPVQGLQAPSRSSVFFVTGASCFSAHPASAGITDCSRPWLLFPVSVQQTAAVSVISAQFSLLQPSLIRQEARSHLTSSQRGAYLQIAPTTKYQQLLQSTISYYQPQISG